MPVGGDTSCASPGYSSISAALAAAPSGALLEVCAGLYQEQLAITQSVSIKAVGAVTIELPASPSDNLTACDADGGAQPNQDVVDICGAASVAITGVTVEGDWSPSVCNDSLYGVAVLGGAHLSLADSTVTAIGGDPLTDGCQGGVGIEVGLATSGTTSDPGSAVLTNDTVSAYQKNGVTIDGAGSSATVKQVTVIGAGPTTAIAQNGIQVSDGARAAISGSFVSGDECNDTAADCGPNGFTQVQSVGILLFDAGKTSVTNSNVTASDIGVYNLEQYPWQYYTPPPGSQPVLDTFSGMGLANRYENAYFDAGKSSLALSILAGGEVGVESDQYSGQPISAVTTATGDAITGATTAAVLVASDGVAGDPAVRLSVTGSNLATSNAAGVSNQSTSVLGAKDDWWGDASGPSSWSFGTGSSVSADVNFFPWATDASLSTLATCTTAASQTTTGNDVVLCARPGTSNAYLANTGSGNVLLLGNNGNDQLIGSATGSTWIIGGTTGSNLVNGNGGPGYLQERGDPNDTLIGTANYTVAAN
ncbi:MAG: autotransporter outer membrane beta-barrel domain-containing protein [Acidimicrobiales bacterium]